MHLIIRFTTPVLISVGRIFRLATSNCQNRIVPLEDRRKVHAIELIKLETYFPAL